MGKQQYAVSKWHDTGEIYSKLDKLVKNPMRPVKQDKMNSYLEYFSAKCKKSKALTDEAKTFIPGGVQHNLAFNYPFPLAIEKAEGLTYGM